MGILTNDGESHCRGPLPPGRRGAPASSPLRPPVGSEAIPASGRVRARRCASRRAVQRPECRGPRSCAPCDVVRGPSPSGDGRQRRPRRSRRPAHGRQGAGIVVDARSGRLGQRIGAHEMGPTFPAAGPRMSLRAGSPRWSGERIGAARLGLRQVSKRAGRRYGVVMRIPWCVQAPTVSVVRRSRFLAGRNGCRPRLVIRKAISYDPQERSATVRRLLVAVSGAALAIGDARNADLGDER